MKKTILCASMIIMINSGMAFAMDPAKNTSEQTLAMTKEKTMMSAKTSKTAIPEIQEGQPVYYSFDKWTEHETEKFERWAQKVALNEKQREQADKIRAIETEKLKPLHEQMEKIKTEIKQIKSETRSQLDMILTEDQKAKNKDMHHQKEKKHKDKKKKSNW